MVLRDLIAPYLLRRRKADVATQLPKKTEQVLFCTLTTAQRDWYRAFLSSKECEDILNVSLKILPFALKNCNLLGQIAYPGKLIKAWH